jgi:hypothetical protein
MRRQLFLILFLAAGAARAAEPAPEPVVVARPEAFRTLVNPTCSHCVDEAKRRKEELRDGDRVLAWIRGYSDGGAIPYRFFLNPYRVISDSYGVFVYDPDAGFARGFAPSYDFRFYGWRNGVMVMQHKDGTLYSCLTGVAFDGPKKGARLEPLPTLVSDWGYWLQHYPGGVAYKMFEKYQPVELPRAPLEDSRKSRGAVDGRLAEATPVLGVVQGKQARAYPQELLARRGLVTDELDGEPAVVLWEPATRTAAAYRPVALQPRKFKGPDDREGTPLPPGSPVLPPRKLTLERSGTEATPSFRDKETGSRWDITGRAVEGELKGWTLTWLDGTQVRWFAWAAEYPQTSIYQARE